jgi:hypothetical protein
MSTQRRLPYFTAADIGRFWGEERDRLNPDDPKAGQPIAPRTVYGMLWHSTSPEGRYYGYPMPAQPTYPNPDLPAAGQHAQWWPAEGQTLDDLERDLRHWWANRPPAGSGNPPGGPRYDDEVVTLVRARAEAGASDAEIAEALTAAYGTSPRGKAFTARSVEGIRRRNDIHAGAYYRQQRKGEPS